MKIHRIYQRNPGVTDPDFPILLVLCATFRRFGVALVAPMDLDGVRDGPRRMMDLLVLRDCYRLMHKREAEKLIPAQAMGRWVEQSKGERR